MGVVEFYSPRYGFKGAVALRVILSDLFCPINLSELPLGCVHHWLVYGRGRSDSLYLHEILFPVWKGRARRKKGAVQSRERLGGLLKYYEWQAA